MRSRQALLARWLIGLVALALLVTGALRIAQMLPERAGEYDFAHYYASSQLWLEGEDPYGTDLLATQQRFGIVASQVDEDTNLHHREQGTNPPPLLVGFAAFATLDPGAAHLAWNGLQALALLAGLALLWLTVRERVPPEAYLVLAGVVCVSGVVYSHFYFSQAQLLLFALVTGAALASLSDRHGIALLLLAAAALLKIYPLALLPWFAWRARREPGSLVPAAALVAVVVALTASLWSAWIEDGLVGVRLAALNESANTSLTSLVANVALWAHGYDIAAVDASWRLGYVFGAGAFALGYAALPRLSPLRQAALLFCVLLVANPTTWPHYLIFAVPALALLLADFLEAPSQGRIALLMALGAVVLWAPNGFPEEAHPLVKIALNYIPLYGLIGVAVWTWREGRERAGGASVGTLHAKAA